MALDRQMGRGEIAYKFLAQETIREVLNLQGWTPRYLVILDRWALNSPEELVKLDRQGIFPFLQRLTNQWALEDKITDSEEFYDMEMNGMSEWEIFKIMEVETELLPKTTNNR